MKKLSKDVYKRQVYQVMPVGLQVKGISVFPMHTALKKSKVHWKKSANL